MRLIIQDLKHWKLKRDALRFGALTLVIAILWVSLELYWAYTRTTVSTEIEDYLVPLNPSLDLTILDTLSGRYVPPEDFEILTTSQTDQLLVGSLPTQVSSPSAGATTSGVSE